jgi:hypothetical protein
MGKSRCTLYREVCPDHGFQHGAEAEELRAGLERILEGARFAGHKNIPIDRLQRLLDRVDARDSLAFLESLPRDERERHEQRMARKGAAG